MMHKAILLFIIPYCIGAQDIPSIQLDRPDQTECPFITPRHYIQIENGFGIENISHDEIQYNFPSTLWKYGVHEKLELRLITELVYEKNNEDNHLGLLPISIGFKTAILEEKGLIPKTSFIGHITTANIGSKAFHTFYIAPSFRFTMQHTITPKTSLAYNMGAEWNDENAQPTYIYTLTTGYGLTNKIGGYLELYGFFSQNQPADHRMDGGLTYLINHNFMVDLSGGLGLSPHSPKNYASLGVSYRFKTH